MFRTLLAQGRDLIALKKLSTAEVLQVLETALAENAPAAQAQP